MFTLLMDLPPRAGLWGRQQAASSARNLPGMVPSEEHPNYVQD